MLTGSADDEDAAVKLRTKFRRQVTDATATRTSAMLGYLLGELLAGYQVEETTRTSYRVAIVARIVNAGLGKDANWGTFIWLAFTVCWLT